MTIEATSTTELPLVDRFQRVCPTHGIKVTGQGDVLECRYGHEVRVHAVMDTVKQTIVASSEATTPRTAAPSRSRSRSRAPRAKEQPPLVQPQSASTQRARSDWRPKQKARFVELQGEALTLQLLQRGAQFKVSWTIVLYRTAQESEAGTRDKIQTCGVVGIHSDLVAAETQLKAQCELAEAEGWKVQPFDPRAPFRFRSVPKPGALRERGKTSANHVRHPETATA